MKKTLLRLATITLMSLSAFAQGTITFYNNGIARPFVTDASGNRTYTYDPNVDGTTTYGGSTAPGRPLISPDGSTYRAGIFRPDGTPAGAGFTAGLFLTSDLTANSSP